MKIALAISAIMITFFWTFTEGVLRTVEALNLESVPLLSAEAIGIATLLIFLSGLVAIFLIIGCTELPESKVGRYGWLFYFVCLVMLAVCSLQPFILADSLLKLLILAGLAGVGFIGMRTSSSSHA